MKRDEQKRLLNEILSGEEMSEWRSASLHRGLHAMRRSRIRRRTLRAGGLALGLAAMILGVLVQFHRRPSSPSGPPRVEMANNPSVAKETAGVERISDDELFALFPGRSVALIGPPGHQQLVFLDQTAKKPARDL